MRLPVLASAVALSLLSVNVVADSVIKVGEGVRLLAHNGKEVSATQLKIGDGPQQVLVRYIVDLSNKVDQSDVQSSDAWVLRFNTSDSVVTIDAPHVRSRSQFSQFNRQGNWSLTDSAKKAVRFEKYLLKKEGFQFARNYESELEVFNRTSHSAALKIAEPKKEYIPEAVVSSAVNTEGDALPMADKMLRYWYQNADQNTRIRFKTWLQSQP